MGLPYSKSQIERLGARLIAQSAPNPADLEMLQDILGAYSEVLSDAVHRVQTGVDLSPTSRVKSLGTILEKLDRQGGSWLKSMHDLAGMRVVADVDLRGQDELVDSLVELFSNEDRGPQVIDRRERPSSGYRAVHVVVFPDNIAVEIQVRTKLQHEWAELFEKLADRIGRGVRYGLPPDHWRTPNELTLLPEIQRRAYEAEYSLRVAAVDLAAALADFIDEYEKARSHTDAEQLELSDARSDIASGLADLKQAVDEFADGSADD